MTTTDSRSLLMSRISRAWKRRTFAEFVGLLLYNLRLVLTGQYRSKNEIYDLSFDQKHGTDTIGREEARFLSEDVEVRSHARGYEPVSATRLSGLFRHLPEIPLDQSHFVDVGSGKGRALLLAARYPFRSITGIEYSPGLHQTAERNIARYHDTEQRCFSIRSVCADASTFDFPAEPTLCFLYNPFDELVMEKTVQNVCRSLEQQPRTFYVMYLNAEHPGPFDRRPAWRVIARDALGGMPFVIWEWAPTVGRVA